MKHFYNVAKKINLKELQFSWYKIIFHVVIYLLIIVFPCVDFITLPLFSSPLSSVLLSAHKRELQKLHTNEVTNKVAYTQTSAIVHISIFKLAQPWRYIQDTTHFVILWLFAK